MAAYLSEFWSGMLVFCSVAIVVLSDGHRVPKGSPHITQHFDPLQIVIAHRYQSHPVSVTSNGGPFSLAGMSSIS